METHRVRDYCIIIAFFIGITLPLFLTRQENVSYVENRNLSPTPTWTWTWSAIHNFPTEFEAFFNDHFGLRNLLVNFSVRLNLLLHTAPHEKLVPGHEGWLFYTNALHPVADYRNANLLTPAQLHQWRMYLETMYYGLLRRGIAYVFVIAPDKSSIYGEFLPFYLQHKIHSQTPHDQLIKYLQENSPEIPLLDLRPALLRAKFQGKLYNKTDTHWNLLGANIAQYELATYLLSVRKANILPLQYSPNAFTWSIQPGKGLANLIQMKNILTETFPALTIPLLQCPQRELEVQPYFPQNGRTQFVVECPDDLGLKVLIFRDSFFETLQPYCDAYFRTGTYIWTRPNFQILREFLRDTSPDIVIEERVERWLKAVPALPPKQNTYWYQVYMERLASSRK